MYNNVKVLRLSFIILSLSTMTFANTMAEEETSSNPQIEIIKESRNKKPVMQTKKWNTPTYEEKTKKSKETDNSKADKNDNNLNDSEDSEDSELTIEQKIWNKYKKIANQGAKKDEKTGTSKENSEIANKDTENDTENDNSKTKTDNENYDNKDQEKEATGLAAILQRYKESQSNKRNMQTRSFGSID